MGVCTGTSWKIGEAVLEERYNCLEPQSPHDEPLVLVAEMQCEIHQGWALEKHM